MKKLEIIYLNPKGLKLRSKNPRTHTAKQIRQIAASIKEFGLVKPVVINNGTILAGYGVVRAAILLELSEVPTVTVDHLTPAQIRAYVIADNKIAENAGWDRALLAIDLKELTIELDFDVTVTGFEPAEIDLLLSETGDVALPEEGESPAVDRSKPAITRLGDLWKIGDHFLYCGNALKKESYRALLGQKKAQMVFVDPPYNVRIAGHVSGLGKIKHGEFAMASGEMTRTEFTSFLATVFEQLKNASINGSIHFACMDWRHIGEITCAGDKVYGELKNLCVWAKTNAGMGSLYRSQHELVFVYKNGTKPHVNNVELGRFGRNRTNLWTYPGATSFGKDRERDLAIHPTVKPVAMVADAILDCSTRGGIILDAFAGSGSTLLGAEKTGRRGYGIELDPYYADVILRRFSDVVGIKAILSGSGETFEQVGKARRKVGNRDA